MKLYSKIALIVSFFVLSSFTKLPGDWYVKDYYKNGNLKIEGWLLHSKKTGFWLDYHSNGEIHSEGFYSNNFKTGYWKEYFSTGTLKNEVQYLKGKKEGWEKSYNLEGELIQIGKYQNGKKEFYWKSFFENRITSKEKWEEGKLIWKTNYQFKGDSFGNFKYYKDNNLVKYGTFEIENQKVYYFDNKGDEIFEESIVNVSK